MNVKGESENAFYFNPELYSKTTVLNSRMTFMICWKKGEGYSLQDFGQYLKFPIEDEERALRILDASRQMDQEDYQKEIKSFSYKLDCFLFELQRRVNWIKSFFTKRVSSR